jgi:CheY-like chemotaxis protein
LVFYRLRTHAGYTHPEMKVLIAEDNATVHRLIAIMISSVAQEIVECANGVEALAAYISHRPDFVLMDISMPNEDGISVTRKIRSLDPTARILIITSHDDETLRREAISAGACGYLVKANLMSLPQLIRVHAD